MDIVNDKMLQGQGWGVCLTSKIDVNNIELLEHACTCKTPSASGPRSWGYIMSGLLRYVEQAFVATFHCSDFAASDMCIRHVQVGHRLSDLQALNTDWILDNTEFARPTFLLVSER
jgi:hypothetical protein